MKGIKRAVAMLLVFACVCFYVPVDVLAEDGDSAVRQTENLEVVQDTEDNSETSGGSGQLEAPLQQDASEASKEAEEQEIPEDVQGPEAGEVSIASVDYIYVEQQEVALNVDENIVIGFKETDLQIDSAVLTYERNGEEKAIDMKNSTQGAVLFQLNENELGEYVLKYIEVINDEGNQRIDLQAGQPASFSVLEETAVEKDVTVEEETSIMIADGTGETVFADSLEDALGQVVEGKENSNSRSLMASPRRADNGNFVVVLDPGHDNTHAGAGSTSTGIREEQYNLAIAQACRNALKNQKGLEVYMVRGDSGACPYPGTTSVQCNTKRTEFAESVDADVYISFHLNSNSASSAAGAEVYVAQNGKFSAQTTELSDKVLDKLNALGLKNRGVKSGDDLTVIKKCLEKGIPAILIEHGFIGNSHDANIIKNQTTQLGQSDANAILEYYQKEIANPQPKALTISPENSAKVGENVTLTVHPKGVAAGYSQYHFIAYSVKTNTWTNLTDYSDKTSYQWQPTDAGDYILGMEAKNPSTGNVKQYITWSYFKVAEQQISVEDIKTSVGKNGLEVTLNAVVNPAVSNAKYYYQVYDLAAGKWIDVAPKSDKKEVVWKPAKAGNYWIHVYVESNKGKTYEKLIEYTVKPGAVYSSELNVKKNTDKSYTLTGKYEAFSGEKVSGMFLAYDGQSWAVIKDWYDVTSNKMQAVKWNPSAKGNYQLCFQTASETGIVSQKIVSQKVDEAVSNNILVKDIRTNKVSPQPAGSVIELSASVEGNITSDMTCIYMCYDGSSWQWIYGSNKVEPATWVPDKAGNYLINYQINGKNGKISEKFINYTVTKGKVVKVTDLTTNLPSPQAAGTEIQLSAKVEGGITSDMSCAYMVYDGTQWNWIYGSNKVESAVWTPEKEGNYLINYQINNSNGKIAEKFINFNVTKKKQVSITEFTTNKTTPQQVGTEILLNAKLEGTREQSYTYAYMVYDGKNWTLIKQSDTLEPAAWTPIRSGDYLLNFQINSATGKVAEKFINFTVPVPDYGIKIQGIDLNRTSPQTIGARISMQGKSTAKITYGLSYKYMLYDCASGKWKLLGSSNTPQTCVWRPEKLGEFWLCYQITTPEGKDTNYIVEYSVEPGYEIAGVAGITVDQMVKYFVKHNSNYDQFSKYANNAYDGVMKKGGAEDVRAFCQIYYEEAIAEGIKPEVAFAQGMLETGFLKFGGLVKPDQYNFAGMGATGAGVSGAAFKDVREGIRAQIQHLKCYSGKSALVNPCVDPRWNEGLRGKAPYIEWLSIPNNPYDTGWASSEWYGDDLKAAIKVLKSM